MAKITTSDSGVTRGKAFWAKGFLTGAKVYEDGIRVMCGNSTAFRISLEDTIDDNTFDSLEEQMEYVTENFFKGGTGPVGDGVQSVTGDGVDNTDPQNPVISFPPVDVGVKSVTGDGVGGTPENPVLTFPTPSQIGAATPSYVDNLVGKFWVPDYANQEAENRISEYNGSWTVPAGLKGWVNCYVWCFVEGSSLESDMIKINGVTVSEIKVESDPGSQTSSGSVNGLFPVKGGDIISFSSNVEGYCYFIPGILV